MASQERGVYQPQEDFASYEDYPEEEGRSRLPLMIVIALVVLAAFAGVVWLAYNQGVAHGRAGAPPIVAAPAGPVRTAPDETQTASGTPSTPYTGLKIYGEPVPPDEEAASSALAPQTPEIVASAPPPPVQQPAVPEQQTRLAVETPAAPPPQVRTPPPQVRTPPPAPTHAPIQTHVVANPAPAVPEIVVATPEPAPAPPPPPSNVTVATQAPRPQPQTTHAPVSPAPPPVEVAHPAPTPTPAIPEATPPAQVAVATPAPAASAPAHTGAAAISGKAVLQIGSYPSEALAAASWKSFHAKHAGTLGALSSDVMTAQIPGKGTWYRLRIGPFSDRAAASAKCAELRAQGATCIIASP